MALPQPVKPYENPISSAASYANQILAGINAGTSTLPEPNVKTPGMGSPRTTPARTIQDRQKMIQDSASRQGQIRLQGLQKQRQVSLGVPDVIRGGGGGTALAKGKGGYSGAFTGGRNGLTPAAGAALDRLDAAYRAQFGSALPIASGGRSRENQAYLYALYKSGKGNLAAPPGSSVHESGRAVDFGGAAHNAGTAQNNWLRQNASRFGWTWAGKNFSQVEPWHYEFTG